MSFMRETIAGLLDTAGSEGLTDEEVRIATGLHHGKTSAHLSKLHQTGRVALLVERRAKFHIYVSNEHVDGRASIQHGNGRTQVF